MQNIGSLPLFYTHAGVKQKNTGKVTSYLKFFFFFFKNLLYLCHPFQLTEENHWAPRIPKFFIHPKKLHKIARKQAYHKECLSINKWSNHKPPPSSPLHSLLQARIPKNLKEPRSELAAPQHMVEVLISIFAKDTPLRNQQKWRTSSKYYLFIGSITFMSLVTRINESCEWIRCIRHRAIVSLSLLIQLCFLFGSEYLQKNKRQTSTP